MSETRLLAAAMAALLACACTTVSPYVRPEGTDRLYQYGNFCGPGLPVAEGQPTAENIQRVAALQPLDDIDMACKVHDLCYLRFGVSYYCDNALNAMLPREHFTTQPCRRLASEIGTGVRMRSAAHDDLASTIARPITAPLAGLMGAMHGMTSGGGSLTGAGWPTAGQCHYQGARADPGNALTDARMFQRFRYDLFKHRDVRAQYTSSYTLENFISGAW